MPDIDIQAELQKLYQAQTEQWTIEELQSLRDLFKDPRWPTWLSYFNHLRLMLDQEVWKPNISWDRYNFLRGQRDVLLRVERSPLEIERLLEDRTRKDKENG